VPDTRPEATSSETDDRRTALRAFFNIADAWQLTVDEQIKLLGSPPRSTFFKWKKEGGHLPQDTVERLSHILSIYKCLRILFTDQRLADSWLKRANNAPFLRGLSAIEFMTKTGFMADIYEVRRYLDAQRGA
jgi:hypothetical protein